MKGQPLKKHLLVLFAVFGLTVSCGNPDGTSTTTLEEQRQRMSEEAAHEARCVDVPQKTMDAISEGLTGGVRITSAAAVKSDDYAEVYMIAGELDGPGLEGEGDVGVWASNSLEPGGGLTLAVDGVANEFSEWPDGRETDAQMSISDDGVSEARDCL